MQTETTQTRRNRWGFSLVVTALLALGACDSDRHGRSTGSTGQEGAEGQAQAGSKGLTIKGSDTMVILAQKWAEAFMEKNPGTTLQVSGGGSGTGIAALINGTTDIANASRQMKPSERKQLAARRAEAVETPVALDALAAYVHQDNPIESLTMEELEKLYRGEIENWKEVGGPDRQVVLYGRENNSGTYVYFKEQVLDDMDFAPEVQTLPGTAAVINAVSKDEGGVGYGGIGYATGVRRVPVAPEGGEPVEPTMTNATSGRYPLSRHLYVYTAGKPRGLAKQYIDFILSAEGQELVEGAGYYPLAETEDADDETGAGEPAPGAAEPPAAGDEPPGATVPER